MLNIPIAELLPHAGDMVLLDKVLEYSQQHMLAELVVKDDGKFGDGKTVPSWLGIEYMAQVVAAHGGLMCRLAGKPVNFGFLLGTRRYQCNVPAFVYGTELIVRVEKVVQDQGMGVFDCKIMGENIAASANLSVYQPDSLETMKIDK